MSTVDQLREGRKVQVAPGEMFYCHYQFFITDKAFEDGKWVITIQQVKNPDANAGLTQWRGPDDPRYTSVAELAESARQLGRRVPFKALAIVSFIGIAFVAGQFNLVTRAREGLPDYETFKHEALAFEKRFDAKRDATVDATVDAAIHIAKATLSAVKTVGDAVYAGACKAKSVLLAEEWTNGFSKAELAEFIRTAAERRRIPRDATVVKVTEAGREEPEAIIELVSNSRPDDYHYIHTGVSLPGPTDTERAFTIIAWCLIIIGAIWGTGALKSRLDDDDDDFPSAVRMAFEAKGLPLWSILLGLFFLPFEVSARIFFAAFQIVVGVCTVNLRRNKKRGNSNE